jgi:acyl-CoA thioester hydrolase
MAPDTTFTFPVRVYWEDTDAGGIVFYANYLKFMERARTEWLRSLGIAQSLLREETGGMFVVLETALRYHRPARLDDELLVTAKLAERGKASLIIAQQVLVKAGHAGQHEGDKPVVLCDGTIRIGWVTQAGADNLRPARIPVSILQSLDSP